MNEQGAIQQLLNQIYNNQETSVPLETELFPLPNNELRGGSIGENMFHVRETR